MYCFLLLSSILCYTCTFNKIKHKLEMNFGNSPLVHQHAGEKIFASICGGWGVDGGRVGISVV